MFLLCFVWKQYFCFYFILWDKAHRRTGSIPPNLIFEEFKTRSEIGLLLTAGQKKKRWEAQNRNIGASLVENLIKIMIKFSLKLVLR